MIKAAISNITDGLALEVAFPIGPYNVWVGKRSLGYSVIITRLGKVVLAGDDIQTPRYLIKTIENATK